jgi:hypothetical protein
LRAITALPAQVRGPAYVLIRTWLADGATFGVDAE